MTHLHTLIAGFVLVALASCGISEQKESSRFKQHFGVYYLGAMAPHFPCEAALRVFDGLPELHLAVLWGTFGTDDSCIKRWASDPRPKSLYIHLSNESCRRLGRCSDLELLPTLSPAAYETGLISADPAIEAAVRVRARAIMLLIDDLWDNTNIDPFFVSLGLEADFDLHAATRLATILADEGITNLVHNPLNYHGAPFGVLLERHKLGAYCSAGNLFANDGTDLDFDHRRSSYDDAISISSLLGTFRENTELGCGYQFVWWGCQQGRCEPSEFVEPSRRVFRIDNLDVLAVNKLLRDAYEMVS